MVSAYPRVKLFYPKSQGHHVKRSPLRSPNSLPPATGAQSSTPTFFIYERPLNLFFRERSAAELKTASPMKSRTIEVFCILDIV